jgi:hypothetical protein
MCALIRDSGANEVSSDRNASSNRMPANACASLDEGRMVQVSEHSARSARMGPDLATPWEAIARVIARNGSWRETLVWNRPLDGKLT